MNYSTNNTFVKIFSLTEPLWNVLCYSISLKSMVNIWIENISVLWVGFISVGGTWICNIQHGLLLTSAQLYPTTLFNRVFCHEKSLWIWSWSSECSNGYSLQLNGTIVLPQAYLGFSLIPWCNFPVFDFHIGLPCKKGLWFHALINEHWSYWKSLVHST